MNEIFSRTELLIGSESVERLKNCRVALFGLGGVGGIAAEALARSGVGTIHLIDSDEVSLSNANRQVIATTFSVGKKKTDVLKERLFSIFPSIKIFTHDIFFLPDDKTLNFCDFDFVIDAVDTVTAKIEIALRAKKAGVPIISVMGTGNKLDPTKVVLGDLFETNNCPLCKVMRRELRKREIDSLPVVYSKELPHPCKKEFSKNGKQIPSSMMFVPATAGLSAAYFAVKTLLNLDD